MKVYMGGLIYLTGCDGGARAYAPKGTGHHAGLWIEGPSVKEADTKWWPDLRRPARNVDGVPLIEFEIPGPAVIRFPGEGEPECINFDDGLPKLKKKQKKKINGLSAQEEDFHVDPETAQTNAVVEILGGSLTPRRLGNRGLVEWTITDPGLTIVVTSQHDPNNPKTITLDHDDAYVMFLNSHELPEVHGDKDALRGDHVGNFRNLNPDPDVTVYAVAAKAPGSVGQLANLDEAGIKFVIAGGCTCGAGSPCCC